MQAKFNIPQNSSHSTAATAPDVPLPQAASFLKTGALKLPFPN
jgi:hypothetical protein